MSESSPSSIPEHLKIGVLGTPGVGKAAIVQSVVQKYHGAPLQVTGLCGAHSVSGAFAWPEVYPIEVHLHTLYGAPDFSSLQRLVLEGCHGFVFVADVHPDRISQAPFLLQALIRDAAAVGVDYATTPVAMQYHRAECFPDFNPAEMDHFLKISPEQIPRFATSSENCDKAGEAIQWVIRAIVSSLVQAPEQAVG